MKNFNVKSLAVVAIISLMGGSVLQVSAAEVKNNEGQVCQSETQYDFEEEVTTFSDLGIMSQALETFMAENPESTETEQEAFLIQFVESGELRAVRNARGIVDNLPGFSSLNSTERELVLKHPIQAIKVYQCASKATDATIEYYGTNGWQDNSDAFRHCCWNALMKSAMNESDAEVWATAHEADSSGIDKEMDLFNNAVGRSIDVSGKSDSEIYEAVKEKVVNGSCRRIVDGELVATDGTGLIK